MAVAIESGRARRVKISGDFFAHPEELFEEAEASLAGRGVEELPAAAAAAFSREGLVIFGAAPADIAEALLRAVDAGSGDSTGGAP